MTDEPKTEDPMVAALLREREGYVGRGMDDRVAQVDEQLRLRGYKTDGEPKPAAKDSGRSTPPKGRRARSTEQA